MNVYLWLCLAGVGIGVFLVLSVPAWRESKATTKLLNKLLLTFPTDAWLTLKELSDRGYPPECTISALQVLRSLKWIEAEPLDEIVLVDGWKYYSPQEIREMMEKHDFARGLVRFYRMRLTKEGLRSRELRLHATEQKA